MILSNVILPLLVGGLIYISFRSLSLRMFSWFDIIGVHNIIYNLREILHPFKKDLPTWVYFSLPDGLWVYSFSSAYLIVWKNQFKIARFWLLIPFTFGCVLELAQLLKIFPGTFDFTDFIVTFLGFTLSLLIFKQNINDKQIQVH